MKKKIENFWQKEEKKFLKKEIPFNVKIKIGFYFIF
jgi:hypothetical protein